MKNFGDCVAGKHLLELFLFGSDMLLGIRTQCLREDKVKKANDQYYNNVALKFAYFIFCRDDH